MGNELQVLHTQEVLGNEFKVYGTVEAPLFLAKDVAEWIDYSWTNSKKTARKTGQMLATIDDDEKTKATICVLQSSTPKKHGGIRENTEMWFLTEDGLYEVLMQSRKPIAKQFKKQVKAILKEIRKTGSYQVNQDSYMIDDPVERAKKWITEEQQRQLLLQENIKKDEIIKIQEPKVQFADAIISSEDSISVATLAKMITQNGFEIGRDRLFEWLRDNGYLLKTDGADKNTPTQYGMSRGWFELTEKTFTDCYGKVRIGKTTTITGKGQKYFIRKFMDFLNIHKITG